MPASTLPADRNSQRHAHFRMSFTRRIIGAVFAAVVIVRDVNPSIHEGDIFNALTIEGTLIPVGFMLIPQLDRFFDTIGVTLSERFAVSGFLLALRISRLSCNTQLLAARCVSH